MRGWLAVVIGCVVVAACSGGASTVRRFDDARVVVHLGLERSGDMRTLVAEFVPTDDHLHLYGLELPDDGIDGAGRPTRLTVIDPAWRASGAATATVPSQLVALAGFDQPFPVYPDGPVTIRQAVESVPGASADARIHVTVTFMACSSAGLCYQPVIAEPLDVAAD